jgi:hypothetical protein
MKTIKIAILLFVCLIVNQFHAQTFACPYPITVSDDCAGPFNFEVKFYALNSLNQCVQCAVITVSGVTVANAGSATCGQRATACAGLGSICNVEVRMTSPIVSAWASLGNPVVVNSAACGDITLDVGYGGATILP